MWYQEDVTTTDFRIEYRLKAGIKPESRHAARAMRICIEYYSKHTSGVQTYEKNTLKWGKEVTLINDFIRIPNDDVLSIRHITLSFGEDVLLEPVDDEGALIALSCPACKLEWSTSEFKREYQIHGPWRVGSRHGWMWMLILYFILFMSLSVGVGALARYTSSKS